MKPKGVLIIYESFSQEKNANPQTVYDKKVSNLKLSGFKVKAHEDVDTKELKSLLLHMYNDMDDISEVIAEKPSFEVSQLLFVINYSS